MKKNYIIIAILGTLWGGLETQVGTLLHAADLPFAGLVMMSIGIFFQTATRQITQLKGSSLLLALVVVFIKLLVVGGIALSTALAIAVEALIIEAIFQSRSPSRLRMAVAGAAAVGYSLFHPFLSMPLLMGLTPADALQRITKSGSVILDYNPRHGLLFILALLLLHLMSGFVISLFTFGFILRLQRRGLAPMPVSNSGNRDKFC
jgi:hypothetical protein